MRRTSCVSPFIPVTGDDPFVGRANLGGHVEFAAVLHRVHGIEEEIEEDLFELVGIGADCIHIRVPGTR